MAEPHVDEIYAAAAEATGKPEPLLREMAARVFASMLQHSMQKPWAPVWTVMTLAPFTVEVDYPPRREVPRG